ncbi:glycosyltransferase [Oceanibacterium hippocampi]|uniref:glycosyltransferase n=1 Tax=Oceanibacterium hippocampi TaxID=745714 RepID=UPI000A26D343|nr:glycosyltransferase [Oceanibacterium hippocampi]
MLHILDKLGVDGSSVHGVSRAVAWWIGRMDADFETHVVSLRAVDAAAKFFDAEGIEVEFVSVGRFDPLTVFALLKLIRRWRPDVLHLHGYGATTFGRLAGFLAGVPRIVHEHFAPDRQAFFITVADWLLAPLTSYAIAVSDNVRDYMVRCRKIPPSRLETFFVGLPLDRFRAPDAEALDRLRGELGLAPGDRILANIGRLTDAKRQHLVIEALPAILEGHPDVHLLIVGDGPAMPDLAALAERLGVAGHVHLLGYRSDIPALTTLADIVVMPSYSEGKSIALLEAMSVGKPIVGTPPVMSDDLLQAGDFGRVIPIDDVPAIVREVSLLLDDPELARRYGETAREIAGDYDLDRSVARLQSIYRALVAGELPRPASRPQRRRAPQPLPDSSPGG